MDQSRKLEKQWNMKLEQILSDTLRTVLQLEKGHMCQICYRSTDDNHTLSLVVTLWWLSIGSDDDICVLRLIYEHGGGSTAPGQIHSLEQCGHWKSVFVITGEAALRCLSLWQQWVSIIKPLRSCQQLCEPSLAILVCPWHIPPGLSDWCGTTGDWVYSAVLVYLGFFCRPGVLRTSGVSASDTPSFESRVQPIDIGPWWWWPLCWWT